MAKIRITGQTRRFICETTLTFEPEEGASDTDVHLGSTMIAPDIMTVTWARINEAAWTMVSIEIGGRRKYADGKLISERRSVKFTRAEDAPRWARSLAASNTPPRK